MQRFGITDLSSASLGKGHMWIGQETIPGLIEVNYVWCPTQGLGTWCVEVTSEIARFDAEITPRPSSLDVSDARVYQLSSDVLGALGAAVDGDIQGEIELLRVASYECPLQNLQELSAQLEVSRLELMGASMGEHQIVARNRGQTIEISINGDSVEGNVNLERGNYEAEGQLTANPQIEAIARSLMRSLGSNRYGWEIKGSIPC